MSIGDNIRTARINKKMNQKELADSLKNNGINVGNTTICNWENGTSKPDPDTIEELCKIFDVDANYLLGFESFKKQDDTKSSQLEQYKILFDKDDRLTEEQKKFFMDFLTEKHKEIDAKLDK